MCRSGQGRTARRHGALVEFASNAVLASLVTKQTRFVKLQRVLISSGHWTRAPVSGRHPSKRAARCNSAMATLGLITFVVMPTLAPARGRCGSNVMNWPDTSGVFRNLGGCNFIFKRVCATRAALLLSAFTVTGALEGSLISLVRCGPIALGSR